ncbi:MAG TPA: hypothetical protein PLI74_11640, partial [Candidatus Kapabacteria bacterium]|nr:hypothetical protein [Candidatus Kapabacteria bacterium]
DSETDSVTIRNNASTARYTFGGDDHEFLANLSAGNPYRFELNNATNSWAFNAYTRNRSAGNTSIFSQKRVNTTSSLNIFDAIQDTFRITPSTGVLVENTISHIVSNNSATTPDSAIQFGLTIAGVAKRVLRLIDRGIQLWNGSTNAIRLMVSSALSVNYDLTLPTTAPTGGQIITHDGTGQQYFENNIYTCLQQVNSNITMQNGIHYITFDDTATRRELTLPTNANSRIGVYIRISRSQYNTDTFRVKQNAGQAIYDNGVNTTEGVTGYLDSTSTDASILLCCFATDQSTFTRWQIISKQGTVTLY